MPALQLPDKPFLRVDEVAFWVRRSKRTVHRWLRDDRIKLRACRLPSGGILIPTTAVAEIIRLSSECYEGD